MMNYVHYLATATQNMKKGWVAPIELSELQCGTLAVPVADIDQSLFFQYSLECAVYQSNGKYDSFSVILRLERKTTLSASIKGALVEFVERKIDNKPVIWNYIGQFSHADFMYPLCEIEPKDEQVLADLYEQEKVLIPGCDPETAYSNFQTVMASLKSTLK